MRQGSKQDDYGGKFYGRRGRAKPGQTRHSFTCDDCGTLQYLLDRELQRAAKPHCKRCGGLLLETESEAKREYPNTVKKKLPPRAIQRRCPGCGDKISHNEELGHHLQREKECFQYHLETDRPMLCNELNVWIIPGTVFIERYQKTKHTVEWTVYGIDLANRWVLLRAFKHQFEAKDWVKQTFGPVNLAR